MDIFQKIGERAKDLKIGEKAKDIQERAKEIGSKAAEMTRKSGELLEVTKIRFEISKLEKEMENNLSGLGVLVYQKYRGQEDVDSEIDRLKESTAKLEDDIRALQKKIEDIQPKPLVCPECKEEVPAGGIFCSYCGKKLKEE